MTAFNKFPQIIKILNAQSAKGLLISMFYLDNLINLNKMLYYYHIGLQFNLYGEVIVLFIQNLIIIALIWKYNKEITLFSKIRDVLLVILYISFFLIYPSIPEFMWKSLISSVSLINLASKMPQIISNFKEKSTGVLSLHMILMSAIRTFARLATLARGTSDIYVLANAFLSHFQYLVLLFQIILL